MDASRALPPGSPRGSGLTIVEFGDYQCPPCYVARGLLRDAVARSKREPTVVFRHFPLRNIHPQAEALAVLSEVARERRRESVFDRAILSRAPESDMSLRLKRAESALGRVASDERARARLRVARDESDAEAIGIEGTPTFLVIRDGEARRVSMDGVLSALR